MGSAEGGSGSERWWESPTLTQADLRQYGESWSLAADAATATLLQSISQRLVSRTHEVEGALKKVLDETDSVLTAISNTNNSFHQLANTQFIENRTYQDDADVARDEPDKQEKSPPTEEEVIARCRSAIAEGLSLVSRSYERHEIQDSDSDDEDSPSSPVPVYALINPYEVKPLPHIIGTAMFMEDDKLGLQESSSEDSSKVTFSPEDTDTEEDLDMEDETDINQKHKPIPASSSRLMVKFMKLFEAMSCLLFTTDFWNERRIDTLSFNTNRGGSDCKMSYERHEIQDSDSDDEDSPSSAICDSDHHSHIMSSAIKGPVPVYALINPYEVKPLPHIIGTAMFMEDDKLGLQESSSEDSSKVTFSPEDTDTEEDLDMEDETDINQKHKPIPASSSRLMDDSDSDWSDEPIRTSNKNPQPPNMTSEEDDDDDDDFFGPSSKSFKQVNNGSNLSSELNKKLQNATGTSQRVSEMDSDTDEDGDLFSRRPDPLASSNSTAPSSTAPVSKPPSLGVENVRAMPDPTGVRLPAASGRLKKSEGNLFASDSEDEGDLFGPKPQPSGNSKSVAKGPSSVKASNQASQRPAKPPSQAPASSLFSSDGDDEEDGGLFGSKPTLIKGTVQNDSEDERQREEPPPLPNEKKVPVGGISIFGSAITSAIRRQQSSDSEQSEKDDSDWNGSRKSSISTPKLTKPASKPESPIVQTTATVKVAPPASRGGGGGGLFDYDDDDDLFGSVVKKNTILPEKTQTDSREEKPVPIAGTATASIQKEMPKRGLFSDDDDDDLFSIPGKTEKKPTIPPTASVTEKHLTGKAVSGSSSLFSDPEEDGLFGAVVSSKPNVSQEQTKSTNPVKVPNISQKNSSLFSSPSDEDDLFSAPINSQVSKAPMASTLEPPPITSSAASKMDVINDLFGSPTSEDSLFTSNASTSSKTNTSLQKDKKTVIGQEHSRQPEKTESKAQVPSATSSIFHSQSDDDDLFAVPKSTLKGTSELGVAHKENLTSSAFKTTQNSLTPSADADIFGSPEDDLFVEKVKSEVIEPMKKASGSISSQQNKLDSKSSSQIDDNVTKIPEGTAQSLGTEKKPVSLFGSPEEEDIFSIGKSNTKSDQLENRPSNSLKPNILGSMSDDEDIFISCPRPAKQKEINVTPTVLSDREQSEVRTSSEHTSIREKQATVDKENRVSNLKDSTQPTLSITKAPVGGVALFGNDELRAKVSERKSMLDSEQESAKITIEKASKEEVKKEKSDLISNQILFDGESDDDIFGISQVTTKQTRSHIPGRGSPPPLPSEICNVSSTSSPEKVSSTVVVPKQSDSPDKKEIEDSPSVVQKEEEKQAEKLAREKEDGMRADPSAVDDSKESKRKEESSEEIKPKKKPPIGGVSMFGGGGLGGSELFAKVTQRKSMLGGSESDSDGESKIGDANTLTHSIEIKQEEKKVPKMSPASKTVANTTATASTQSLGVRRPEVKSGGQENSISFDEPVTTNTLDSLNKSRVRGSVKRRPPSRAHRKGAAGDSSQTIPSVAQTPSNRVPELKEANTRKSNEKDAAIESSSHSDPPVEDQLFSSSENEDDMFRGNQAKNINKIERSVQVHQTSGTENRITSTLSQRVEMQGEVEEDLFSKLQSASCTTKTQNFVKPSSKSQPSSLFGEDDSDEDLFGPSNSKLSHHKATESAVQQEVSKKEIKPIVSQSLFGDDDDDIFSSTGTVGKTEASVVKKMSTSKSKTSLTSTSEPFDDPLLGPRK
ncbi:WASH complex subunit 2C-like [Penaeus indicus]|uniref:WASH complex subunit 2C-like n=1 Tax=Penaeus indicus TaxID=29960 RepID=UPI00300D2375